MKLVTLDLDGTLLPRDTAFAAVLRDNGRGADVAVSDADYYAGKTSIEECFWQQWAWVQQLTLADMHRALRKAAWLPGIAEGVQQMRQSGTRVALLTDQPSILTDFLGRWGLIDAICSPVTVKDGKVTGIDARFDKWANLKARLEQWQIPASEVCHVGNGVNDVPVWRNVGFSCAVFAAPEVAQHANIDLGEPGDLPTIVRELHHAGRST